MPGSPLRSVDGVSCTAQPSQPVPAARVIRGLSERARQAANRGRDAAQPSSASSTRRRRRAGSNFQMQKAAAITTMSGDEDLLNHGSHPTSRQRPRDT